MRRRAGVVFGVVFLCVCWLTWPVEALEPHESYGDGGSDGRVPGKGAPCSPHSGHHQDAERVERPRVRTPQESSRRGSGGGTRVVIVGVGSVGSSVVVNVRTIAYSFS